MDTGTSPTKETRNRAARSTENAEPRRLSSQRVRVAGKFLYCGDHRFSVKGVTYGPFRPNADGSEYHDPPTVARDFATMRSHGINAVRTYTVPPRWLLDAAGENDLRVLVGLPWEQHITFLDNRRSRRRIRDVIRDGVRACDGHGALLGFTVGNEIPAPIVRWHGRSAIESFLESLYDIAKSEDPSGLVSYVSYPTTEYLELPFLDFVSFNVFLEREAALRAYLARLQNLAGERPLVMAEVGLDSLRNGDSKQAETLAWQVRETFQAGCAGTFVFSWTDEWHRGGHDILDWNFGLTTRQREPKPALGATSEAFAKPLTPPNGGWPRISVVVCSYNGSRTLRECLDGVARIDYPDFEVIVVDDGSTDQTPEIAREYPFRLISAETNIGLSGARNIGMRAATGEIVAYLDDDAYPDPTWLSYLALAFETTPHVGVGGPNIAPHGDGLVAECVAHSPGGPSHVLRSDTEAEHLPGCNMAFRREAILAIDGFDQRFRIAGDDVDLCWRLIDNGGTLGFSPGAMVWHHRRGEVRGYLRQQFNYGKAEGMLEQKWPAKYNRLGHMRWAGQLYGKGHTASLAIRRRIDYGEWGSRLFQAMYATGESTIWSLTLMPEWYLVTFALAGLSILGLWWSPLLLAIPLFVIAAVVPVLQAALSAARARFDGASKWQRGRKYALTFVLHTLQPVARLFGRMRCNLTPWRLHGAFGFTLPWPRSFSHWSEQWREQTAWIASLERRLLSYRLLVRRGGSFDRWDLQADSGLLGGVRLLSTVEEHGAGKQLIRISARPTVTRFAIVLAAAFAALTFAAAWDAAWIATTFLASALTIVIARAISESGCAKYSVLRAVKLWQKGHGTTTATVTDPESDSEASPAC